MEKMIVDSKISQKTDWLDVFEVLSVLGTLGGAAASVVFQQFVFISVPLSLSLGLNLVNRRRQLVLVEQAQQRAIAPLILQRDEDKNQLAGLLQQVTDCQKDMAQLKQGMANLEDKSPAVTPEQKELEEVLNCLGEIETCTQMIQLNPTYAKAYYNRALLHQRLKNYQGAIADYTQAIKLQPDYAKAYYNRAVARSQTSDRKGAIEDLRAATKLFFDQGEIACYQKARELHTRLHDLSPEVGNEGSESEELALECLFA